MSDDTEQELERACKVVARAVRDFGDMYLPIFERLHSELLQTRERQKIKFLALSLVAQYNEVE